MSLFFVVSTARLRCQLTYYGLLVMALMLISAEGQAQTARTCRWDRGANTDNYLDAANWDNDQVPTSIDNALFDHSLFTGEYDVIISPTQRIAINSLQINPGSGDSIRVEIPSSNTLTSTSSLPAAFTITGNGGVALAIYNKGVFTNASGAITGNTVDISGTGASLFIYNGGTYRHYTASGHAAVVENISTVAGTENGTWVFRRSSGILSLSNRSYPNLILRCPDNQAAATYGGSGAGVLTVRGNLIVAPKATFAPSMTGEIRIAGNLLLQGSMRFAPNSSGSAGNGTLTFNGQNAQLISGTAFETNPNSGNYLSEGVTMQITNTSTAGVTLQSSMTVSGTLKLISGLLNINATNLLTLANNAQGGSNSSFVNGPVARVATTTGSIAFPLGRNTVIGTAYRPLVLDITTLANPTTFTAVQQEGAYDAANLNGDLKRVSKTRSFQVTPNPLPSAGQFVGTIALSFGPDDFVTNPEANSLVIAKNSGSGWVNIGHSASTSATSSGAYVTGTLTSAPFTSFSQFAIGNTDANTSQNPLPVSLISFSATWKAAGVYLCWTTATEKDNSHFDVQRSTDGQHFETIDQREGQKQSTQTKAYTSFDSHMPAANVLYYRLCQVDEDGTATYSGVRTVKSSSDIDFVYPNPTTDRIVVKLSIAGKADYYIENLIGQVVLSGKVSNGDVVHVGSLPDGVYYFKLKTASGRCTYRFIKHE